jgi:hypothetical protein
MPTYTPIATQTLSSSASSVIFSSIPQGYTDLVLVCSFFKSATNVMGITLNNDSSALYSYTTLWNNGNTPSSARGSNDTIGYFLPNSNHSTTNPNTYIAHFLNYSNSTTFKTILGRGGVPGNSTGADINLYRSTSPITQININTR